jgi:hypothetical protein
MQSNWIFVVLGLALVVLGVVLARRGSSRGHQMTNVGGSVSGDVRQTISNVQQTGAAGRETKSRQWVGWGLSIIGLLLSAWGLFHK